MTHNDEKRASDWACHKRTPRLGGLQADAKDGHDGTDGLDGGRPNGQHARRAGRPRRRACKKDCDTGGFDDGLLKCEGPRLVTIDTKLVQVTINKALGGWGGKCRCPDGGVYYAADNGDRCKTLACTGGTKVDCNQYDDKKWRHKKVTCKAS